MAKKKKRKQSNNRLTPIVSKLIGTEKPQDLFSEVANALSDSQEKIPSVNAVYVFTYNAVTPGLLTDRFPLVGVTGVYDWGFTGINLHLEEPRNYNYNNVGTPLYRLKPQEVSSAQTIPLMKLVQNG